MYTLKRIKVAPLKVRRCVCGCMPTGRTISMKYAETARYQARCDQCGRRGEQSRSRVGATLNWNRGLTPRYSGTNPRYAH